MATGRKSARKTVVQFCSIVHLLISEIAKITMEIGGLVLLIILLTQLILKHI